MKKIYKNVRNEICLTFPKFQSQNYHYYCRNISSGINSFNNLLLLEFQERFTKVNVLNQKYIVKHLFTITTL